MFDHVNVARFYIGINIMIPTSFISIIFFGLCSFERLLLTCVRDKDQSTLHIDQSNLLIEMMTCISYLPLSVGIIQYDITIFEFSNSIMGSVLQLLNVRVIPLRPVFNFIAWLSTAGPTCTSPIF